MSISEEVKQKIISNNEKISELLAENEQLLRSEGLEVPETNFAVDDDQKVHFPTRYIRPKEYLVQKYHLEQIAGDWIVRSNIGYALQLSDLHNYILNRFRLWGPVATMFYKSAVVNLISVLEAMIFECATQMCYRAGTCKLNRKKCKSAFNQTQRNNSFAALKRINELEITTFSSDELDRIKELIDLRNRVHIRLSNEKEFTSKEFNLKLYNEVIQLMQRVSDEIYQNGVPQYKSCQAEQNRAELAEIFGE